MKQHAGNSKPPPARSASYARAHTEHLAHHNLLSMDLCDSGFMVTSENCGDISPSHGDKISGKVSSKDINECISGWLSYLQNLNALCGSGSRLSHSLGSLLPPEHQSACGGRAVQCQAAWDDLSKVVAATSSSIRSQVVQALQELNGQSPGAASNQEAGQVLAPAQQAVVCHSLMTMISLQYQFCMACCECLGMMAPCHCCVGGDSNQQKAHDSDCIVTTLQHYFNRLYVPSTPTSRSPLLFPLWPLQSPQRRWSEAAAREVSGSGIGDTLTAEDGGMRRWSMPWDSSGQNEQHGQWTGRLYQKDKLTVPGGIASQERSRSTTPESLWQTSMASQEELSDVISLLSCKPNQPLQLHQPSHHIPGVTLTGCSQNSPSPSHQPTWVSPAGGSPNEDRMSLRHGSGSPAGLGTSPGRLSPHQHQSGQQNTSHQQPTHQSHIAMGWTESSSVGSQHHPPDIARKGSSSDSSSLSSSLSLHRSSTSSSDTGMENRSHLYSMWSGADLPFIKLPENSELREYPISPRGSPNSQRYPQ
ncbi:hypothetical protein FOCC_FOCC004540 [Frankliniella occidentalis]|uniref:Uncharacterized protein LOC113211119 n=1 Tax=Frankliniella occidentalis TaxID=133901 RepID=A0A6J1SV69_FRAOC|nr:uncharacterized protein LOC113211119 [Frankliniella occidentalis]XP_026285183.1 uncharacterized protein LOC113211119 [Frankliniella occidentalis]XP_026285185.1 uncharacterized protein LOC113211119 [Frankliniella occidentalis]KAE8748737.1 hypothetical protein FOCC_FOCC004540 [Frankliniella occidentalis]